MIDKTSQDFQVGEWRVAPGIDEISREGNVVKLEPRAMRVLVCLAEHAGEVVSVDQLLDAVWKDVVVTPESVYQAVAVLRRAFDDDPKRPAYIANVVRRGYRLVAPVTRIADGEVTTTSVARAAPETGATRAAEMHRLRRMIIIGAATALVAGVAGKVWFEEAVNAPAAGHAKPAQDLSIAVLPFADMSEQHDQEYFADGMAEEILDTLARIPQLKVIGRMSSFQFKGKNEDLRVIGGRLGASYVVQGSVRKVGGRVRVTSQLIEVSSGVHLWAGSYDREFDDLLNVQDQIAASIGRALQLVVVSDDPRPRQMRSTEAYTFYLRGRAALDRGDEAGAREAIGHLEQALALDPKFTRASEALALAHLSLLGNGFEAVEIAWPKASDAARAALRLDPNSPLAHAVLGLRYATYDYDWQSAEKELDLALASSPRDPVAMYNLSWLAFDLGRHDDAINLSEASLSIDPLNPDACQNSAYIYYLVGKLEAAERDARRSLAISPSFTGNHKLIGQIRLLRGQPEAALAEMRLEVESQRDVGLALSYFALGRRSESDAALARALKAGDRMPVEIAIIHAFRGEHDQAFAWLEKAVVARDISLGHKFRDEPKLAPLRGDSRYVALLQRMNLAR